MSYWDYVYWAAYGGVAIFLALMGMLGAAPSAYRSDHERRNWARCAWLAPIWPGVVGWFVSKWLGMFVAFMWRTAWSKGSEMP